MSPSVSEKQRRFMGAELARKREGKRTRTGMSEEQLREFASKVDADVGRRGRGRRAPRLGGKRAARRRMP